MKLSEPVRHQYAKNATALWGFAQLASFAANNSYRGKPTEYWLATADAYQQMADTGEPSETLKKTLKLVRPKLVRPKSPKPKPLAKSLKADTDLIAYAVTFYSTWWENGDGEQDPAVVTSAWQRIQALAKAGAEPIAKETQP